ncbi:MAG: hypothetical protein ACK5PF_02035 [bacterium]|jgi:hypothetical protein
MTHYRKKPVVIEAFRVHPDDGKTRALPPPWFIDALLRGEISITESSNLAIKTLEGVMTANVGDWVIRGIKGELYPCKNDIFEATYEPLPKAA